MRPLRPLGLSLFLVAGGCGGGDPGSASKLPVNVASADGGGIDPTDPLGPKPAVGLPEAFVPPVPTAYDGPLGIKVWLLEKHALPLVAVTFVSNVGSSSDPPGKSGLAYIAADMMDEGAGKHDALGLAREVDKLGAHLSTAASSDASTASLGVLKRNLDPAFALLADVVARPLFGSEWGRVSDLWKNGVKARMREAKAVANVALHAVAYGEGTPYGHPISGTTGTAAKIELGEARQFYQAAWSPKTVTLVAVGDITRSEIDALLEKYLATWKSSSAPPKAKPPSPFAPPPSTSDAATVPVVLVDKADAPQAILALVRPGIPLDSPDYPALSRANLALGGSFTSRLNQDLREAHAWSYGASSRLTSYNQTGLLVAQAAVVIDHVGDAAKAMLGDVQTFAKGGLTAEEVDKTRMHARSELVEEYERLEGAAGRLARFAALGLPPDFDAKQSALRDQATKADLDREAATYFQGGMTLVVVGPRVKVEPQLSAIGLSIREVRDPEGHVIAPASK